MHPFRVNIFLLSYFYSLRDQVRKAVPYLEVYNKEQIVEAGFKFKEEIMKIKQDLMKTKVGTLAGDRILEDAENDDNIVFKDDMYQDENDDSNNQDGRGSNYGVGKLNQLFSKFSKNQSKTD